MCVEVRPCGNHTGPRDEPKGRFHPHHPGELGRDAIGAAIIGAERRERHAGCDGDRRTGARATGGARTGRVVRIQHLPGVAARSVATIGEIVGGGLAEDDRAGSAEPRHLERVTLDGVREEARPLGVGPGGWETHHVVDRFGEDGDTVERPAHAPCAPPGIGGARLRQDSGGQHIDCAPRVSFGATPVERAGGDLSGRPCTPVSTRLVLGDRANEWIGADQRIGCERERHEGGELGEGLASGHGHWLQYRGFNAQMPESISPLAKYARCRVQRRPERTPALCRSTFGGPASPCAMANADIAHATVGRCDEESPRRSHLICSHRVQ